MRKSLLRAMSVATLICFMTTELAWGIPDIGISGLSGRETPTFLQIEIPQNLASIEDIYEAPAKKDPSLILHIQNLHGNYEAQTQIKKLLDYLYKTYAFKLIFVEGAAEKLNADYLRLFSDDDQNRELADYLTHKGQLTGPEFYLVDGPKDVEAVGIEQEDLYRKNLESFRKVYGAKQEIDQKLAAYDSKIDLLSSMVFSQDTRRNISEWRKFESGHRDFLPYLKRLSQEAKKVLGLDLESLFAQVEWPQVTRLLVIQSMETDLNLTAANQERERLAEFLTRNQIDSAIVDAVKKLGERRISMTRLDAGGQENHLENLPRYLLERLVAEAGPKGFYFHDYPAFSLYAGYLILQSELQSQVLYEEINLLFEKILAEQTPSEKEKNLLELFRDTELLKKLLHLELTRKEWSRAAYRKEWINPQTVERRLQDLEAKPEAEMSADKDPSAAAISPAINSYFEASLEFYDFARAREGAFFETIEKEMGASKTEKAVLVTGGFHTDGLMDLFRENQINYGVLLPRISGAGLSADNKYSEAMMESGSTMFDLATIEINNMLQTPGLYASLGGELWESVQQRLEGFVNIGNYPSVSEALAELNFLNNTLFAKNFGIRLIRSNEGPIVLQVTRDALVESIKKEGKFNISEDRYLRSGRQYVLFDVTEGLNKKTGAMEFKILPARLQNENEQITFVRAEDAKRGDTVALPPAPPAKPLFEPVMALSELRSDKKPATGMSRRQFLLRTVLAVSGLVTAGYFVSQNLVSVPETPIDPLSNSDLSLTAQDTLQGLLKLRSSENGMPFNQASGFETPVAGWLKSSDIGFMWTSDILMAAQHAKQITQEETAHPDQVTRRIFESLKMYQKMVNSFGLKIDGKETGILPEFLIHQKSFFKTRKDLVPGTDRRNGVTFSSYDMLLTLQRLKIVRDVFQGGRVPGLKNDEIVNLANKLLSQTTVEPFVDAELRIHHQIVQDESTRENYLSEHVMDNAHTEARGLVHILDQFGNVTQSVQERVRRGEEIWKELKVKAQWTNVKAGSNSYRLLQGDSALSVFTEIYGAQFWGAEGDLKASNQNYLDAARAIARDRGDAYFGTAPGTGDTLNSYAQFGLRQPDRTVIAGPAMLVTNGDRASFEQMIQLSRASRLNGAYQSGWGFVDQVSPSTGVPETRFGTKNYAVLYMNNGLVAESLHYFILREIMSQSPDRGMIERNLSVTLDPIASSQQSPRARSDVRTAADLISQAFQAVLQHPFLIHALFGAGMIYLVTRMLWIVGDMAKAWMAEAGIQDIRSRIDAEPGWFSRPLAVSDLQHLFELIEASKAHPASTKAERFWDSMWGYDAEYFERRGNIRRNAKEAINEILGAMLQSPQDRHNDLIEAIGENKDPFLAKEILAFLEAASEKPSPISGTAEQIYSQRSIAPRSEVRSADTVKIAHVTTLEKFSNILENGFFAMRAEFGAMRTFAKADLPIYKIGNMSENIQIIFDAPGDLLAGGSQGVYALSTKTKTDAAKAAAAPGVPQELKDLASQNMLGHISSGYINLIETINRSKTRRDEGELSPEVFSRLLDVIEAHLSKAQIDTDLRVSVEDAIKTARSEVREITPSLNVVGDVRPSDDLDRVLKLGVRVAGSDIPETASPSVKVGLYATLAIASGAETFKGIREMLRERELRGSKTQYDEIIVSIQAVPGINALLNQPGIVMILTDKVPSDAEFQTVAGLAALSPDLGFQFVVRSEVPLTPEQLRLIKTIQSGKDRSGKVIGNRFEVSVLEYVKAIQFKLQKTASKLANVIAESIKARGGEADARKIQENFVVLGLKQLFEGLTLNSGLQVIGAGEGDLVLMPIQSAVSARLAQVKGEVLTAEIGEVIQRKAPGQNVFEIVRSGMDSISDNLAKAFAEAYKIATSA